VQSLERRGGEPRNRQRRLATASAEGVRRGAVHVGGSDTDWLGAQYQLANRLAFLYYLRCRLEQQAWLVLVYFTGESEPGVDRARFPTSAEKWDSEIHAGWRALGLVRGEHPLADSVIELFLPVFEQPTPAELARAVPEAVRSDITRYIAQSPAP
jgi:hypothetical protein